MIPRNLTLASLFVLLILPASAQDTADYCIKCVGPSETYVCRLASNGGQVRGQQLFCIMNIAREKGHESCAAKNTTDSCYGVLVSYDIAAPQAAPAPSPHVQATAPDKELPPAAEKTKKEEPKTLVEFSKQTVKATQKGLDKVGTDTNKAIKNTGETIGGFAGQVGQTISKASKNTFNCITSLFSNCTGE